MFTRDWSASREHWPALLAPLMLLQSPRVLEIGCFEGQATCWFLDNLRDAAIDVIDPFDVTDDQFDRFIENTGGLVAAFPMRSQDFRLRNPVEYELVYVDGDHSPSGVLHDAVLAFKAVKPGGMILFDDYDWPNAPSGADVRLGVDSFVACYEPHLTLHGPTGVDQYVMVKA